MTLPQQYTITTPYIVGPVHCYSAMLGGDLVLFDCGPPTMECRQFLKKNIDLARVRHVIITHGHIDHWGQALWLAEQGITVYLPFADHLKISRQKQRQQEVLALLDEAGFSAELMAQFNKICKEDVLYPAFPPGYRIVEYDLPKKLGITAHSCPGHSVSDLVFAGDGWIISGDTLLEGVFQSPLLDVDLQKGGRFQNYLHWCETIVTLAQLEGNTICPGHRDTPQGVCQTIIQYIRTLLYRTRRFLPYRHENDLMRQIEYALVGRIKGPFHIYLKASEIIFIKDLLANPRDRAKMECLCVAISKKHLQSGPNQGSWQLFLPSQHLYSLWS